MKVVGSERLMSSELVTTGVGPDSLVASTETDLLGRLQQSGAGNGFRDFSNIFTTTELAICS